MIRCDTYSVLDEGNRQDPPTKGDPHATCPDYQTYLPKQG